MELPGKVSVKNQLDVVWFKVKVWGRDDDG